MASWQSAAESTSSTRVLESLSGEISFYRVAQLLQLPRGVMGMVDWDKPITRMHICFGFFCCGLGYLLVGALFCGTFSRPTRCIILSFRSGLSLHGQFRALWAPRFFSPHGFDGEYMMGKRTSSQFFPPSIPQSIFTLGLAGSSRFSLSCFLACLSRISLFPFFPSLSPNTWWMTLEDQKLASRVC